MVMAQVDDSIGKAKLAKFVNEMLGPSIDQFIASLTDDEIVDLLKNFKTMQVDLIRDLTEAAKQRKIQSNQWQEDSPFDKIMEEGLK
jgi:hypothetical protein